MASVLNPVWGGVVDALGIISFIMGVIPSRPAQNIANVRICAGMNDASNHAQGRISRVKIYNNQEQLIGNVGGNYLNSGQYRDFAIQQANNQQAAWVSIAGDSDPVCISYASTQWVDGSKYGWTGDWAVPCGWEWHWGNVYVSDSGYAPRCAWISTDKNQFKVGMYKIHWPSFVNNRPQGNSARSYCSKSGAYRDPFKMMRREIDANGTAIEPAPVRRNQTSTTLIVSNNPAQSARELCESPTAWGPDFINLVEGLYCNLGTGQLIPLCDKNGVTSEGQECFELDTTAHVKRDGSVNLKGFTHIQRWDVEGGPKFPEPVPDQAKPGEDQSAPARGVEEYVRK